MKCAAGLKVGDYVVYDPDRAVKYGHPLPPSDWFTRGTYRIVSDPITRGWDMGRVHFANLQGEICGSWYPEAMRRVPAPEGS
jgi:hypothetical protein